MHVVLLCTEERTPNPDLEENDRGGYKKLYFTSELKRISRYEPGGHRGKGWFLAEEMGLWQRQRLKCVILMA